MKTPLHDKHLELKARMVDFAGWQMPVQYEGIIPEHRHTRKKAALFDICHMGEFRVSGAGAVEALAKAIACRVKSLKEGAARYGYLLNEKGGTLDDLICYNLGDYFMIVSNAGTRERDIEVIKERLGDAAEFEDISDQTAKLDLQGPESPKVIQDVFGLDVGELGRFKAMWASIAGAEALISRTGYTGENGFELYIPPDFAEKIWDMLLAHDDVNPAGLGARDTLRLEAGLPLYGHELNDDITPLEAGGERFLPKGSLFIGGAALKRLQERGIERSLTGIVFEGRRAAREGDALFCDDVQTGAVTSGSFAPTIGKAIAMGYVKPEHSKPGLSIEAESRGRRIKGETVALPFYRAK